MAEIVAEWPGMVKEIHVAVGDAVTEDQEVLVLESMKMLTPVLATAAGTVTEVHVDIENYVEVGAVLLTLE
jgi:acetyl-CoA carboxylase biotin carboxyl carrier protein